MTMWTFLAHTAIGLAAGLLIGMEVRYTWIR